MNSASLVNPNVIQNKEQREIKISMLLRKPFVLADDRIQKTNEKISRMGMTDTFPVKKVAKLPAKSLFGSNPAIRSATNNANDTAKMSQSQYEPVDWKAEV